MKKEFQSYLLVGFILLLIYLAFLVVKGFISAIIWAGVFAFIFRPFYKRLEKKLKNKTLSSLFICFIIVVAVLLPLIPLVSVVGNQLVNSYSVLAEDGVLNSLPDYVSSDVNLNAYLKQSMSKLVTFLASELSEFVLSIPAKLISFFVFLYLLFYLLKEGPYFMHQLKSMLPLPITYKEKLLKEATIGTRAILYGVVVAAVAQGIIGTIGLIIFRVPNALFWGVIMTFLSLIPFVGAWLVWFPAAIWLVVSGHPILGVGLLLYGILIVSSIDNIVKSKVIGTRAKIHPAIVFVGLIGGLLTFGVVGIIVGPILLSFLIATLKLYRDSE